MLAFPATEKANYVLTKLIMSSTNSILYKKQIPNKVYFLKVNVYCLMNLDLYALQLNVMVEKTQNLELRLFESKCLLHHLLAYMTLERNWISPGLWVIGRIKVGNACAGRAVHSNVRNIFRIESSKIYKGPLLLIYLLWARSNREAK